MDFVYTLWHAPIPATAESNNSGAPNSNTCPSGLPNMCACDDRAGGAGAHNDEVVLGATGRRRLEELGHEVFAVVGGPDHTVDVKDRQKLEPRSRSLIFFSTKRIK